MARADGGLESWLQGPGTTRAGMPTPSAAAYGLLLCLRSTAYRLLPIHLLRVEHLLPDDLPVRGGWLVLAVETTVIPIMAGRAGLFDLDQDHIPVAVGGDALDLLDMAARFTLEPQLVAAAAEEMGLAGLDGLFQ